MASTSSLNASGLDLGDLSELFNMAANSQQQTFTSDDILLSLLNGDDQLTNPMDLYHLDPSQSSPVSSTSSRPSSPSSSIAISPHNTVSSSLMPSSQHAGGVSDPLLSCVSGIASHGEATSEMLVVTTSGLPADSNYVVDMGNDSVWMMTSQDDVDFETLDEGVGDSVEDTSISLEGQESLVLSDEEKRLLLQEGVTLPEQMPLTKSEEKALKRVRRKIKNKMSAQESRKKKKVYVDGLEKRVEQTTKLNRSLQKKVQMLENQNQSLLQQLKQLQGMVGGVKLPSSIQTGTCVMVLVLSFALFLWPSCNPFSRETSPVSYTSSSVKSRSLLHTDENGQRIMPTSHTAIEGQDDGRLQGKPENSETDVLFGDSHGTSLHSENNNETGELDTRVSAADTDANEAGKDAKFRVKDDDL
ncbi:cyclic AMP-responsive element-binding protein 3-like protein 4 [Corticium candelabrum]|uniref:cyclic AMP-responsive element-binding protein 3-like protein 4 n=1 Tax=Corticium candelabrum TaxID=121492 RepID=UPI002E25D8A2|nr:cyclic AMP-responsive element-binding protein 3-like protein 4 [Corticium candelabrum]